jgi:hypothetical protein
MSSLAVIDFVSVCRAVGPAQVDGAAAEPPATRSSDDDGRLDAGSVPYDMRCRA